MTAQPNVFDITIESDRTCIRFRLAGELDVLTTRSLAEQTTGLSLDGSPPAVVLDLSGLTFIDAAGLRELLHTRDRLEEAGHHVRFGNASLPVVRLTRILGIDLERR